MFFGLFTGRRELLLRARCGSRGWLKEQGQASQGQVRQLVQQLVQQEQQQE
jgi:hypothetical protein